MSRSKSTLARLLLVSGASVSLLISGCMPPATQIDASNIPQVKAKATKADFTDRVMVTWSKLDDAASYRIYKADTADGPYTAIKEVVADDSNALVENADPYIVDVVVPDPDGGDGDTGIDPAYLNFSWTSGEDVSSGKNILSGQTPKLRILMGSASEEEADMNIVVSFPSLDVWWNPLTWFTSYTPGLISSAINEAAAQYICDISDDGSHLEFISRYGPIVFMNENNTMSYSPIDYFILDGVGNDEILVVNKDGAQIMGEDEFTGNFADYFGEEPTEPGTDPGDGTILRPRIFEEDKAYYTDDLEVTLGNRYYYRVQALRANGTLIALSRYNDGWVVSPTASAAPQNLTVSQGEFNDRAIISWEPVSGDGITYNVYRTTYWPGQYDMDAPLATGISETSFEDATIPAGLYMYIVTAVNADGEESKSTDSVTGYRTVSDAEFLRISYYEVVWAEKMVAQMLGVPRVADYDSGADANVTDWGNISGTANYKLSVKVSTMSGRGTWTYTNYSNFSVIMNGSVYMDSNASKDGTVVGTVNVSGIYSGTLEYNVVINDGDATNDGYFYVTQTGGERVRHDFYQALLTSPY